MSQVSAGSSQGPAAGSEPQLADVVAAIQSMSQDVRSHVDRRIDAVERKAAAPSLKSTSLNVQHQLLETWIGHLEEASETCSHPRLDLAKAEMRARVQILKKGDAEPTFFRFFDDLRAAKPESPLAEVTTEALQKFAELQASGSRPASTTLGPLRKRPFRGSGAGDSRAFTAYFHRDQVELLSQQVHQLQQQLLLGSRPQQAPGRFTSGGRSIQCFNCRGHGHFRGTVPKAEPVANKKSDSVVGLSVPARYKTNATSAQQHEQFVDAEIQQLLDAGALSRTAKQPHVAYR
ncbi:hypothetical protein L596_010839 [Steinernema carpocapsae]|uniref:Uncharacterized protein n=1 Tax=Steinernema carpocapsae TaxID=34508 RepID=A0A4U5PJP5_STECR|nr:hypothetical protein L596_010839 [Steinernema carpocapsae]